VDALNGAGIGKRRPGRCLAAAILAAAGLAALVGDPSGAATDDRLFEPAPASDGSFVVTWERRALAEAHARGRTFTVRRFPLRSDLAPDLVLEPFSITGPGTRFVVGAAGEPDRPLNFDSAAILLFRGGVAGVAGSHVFLALGDDTSTGYVDLGPGESRYRVASRAGQGDPLQPGSLSVFRAMGPPDLPPDVPLCGVAGGAHPPPTGATTLPPVAVGLRHLELAVETDHEFFVLFDGATAAAAYLVQLYAEVSDLFARDVDTHIELVFARIWETPADPFDGADPLPQFRTYWNANMGSVQRDVAQLLSGRRNYPFGGQAYLGALCGSSAYSVVGYALGFLPDPRLPSPYNYDVHVTAHELGHNCGTGHTQDQFPPIDSCHNPNTTPQRGTIMSYCSQTWSGGNGNTDLYFHSVIEQNMEQYMGSVACVVADCNANNVADSIDIAQAGSLDQDRNGIPDECEDCNTNGVLDGADIARGTSLDLDGNSVPDECEPDCNLNGITDKQEIADGASSDAYGNGIPDECEIDCDDDAISDYTEIQLDMSLDVDRNAALDACQDCDADGTLDMEALGGAHGLWVASGLTGEPLLEFHASSGVQIGATSGGIGASVKQGQDLIVTADGRVLVTSKGDDRVMQFDLQGTYLGNLVTAGAGGLDAPTGLILGPGATTLLVASSGTDAVLAYDATDGTPLGAFVTAGAGGLDAPFGLTFTRAGALLVTSAANEVLAYDGEDGSFVGAFVSAANNGGLDQPRGMTFKPDGNLLVASFGTNEVLEFDGSTGAPLGKWAQVGTASVLTQEHPWGIRVGPNGNVFVGRTGSAGVSLASGEDDAHDHSGDDIVEEGPDIGQLHLSNTQVYEYDARNGNFLRNHVGGNDHDLVFPTGFDFVPGWQVDCNLNLLPDSCDIAQGRSTDADASGVPDECEIDCNANGVLDRLDILPYGTALDCNANLSPDGCDLAGGSSLDCNANGRPDECESAGCAACTFDPDCDDGLTCTSQTCHPLLGQCQAVVNPGVCLIGGACFAAAELNPSDPCEICDPASPFGWSTNLPPEVGGLLVSQPGLTRLTWVDQGGGASYDIAGGSLSAMHAGGGVAGAECLQHDTTASSWDDPRLDPPLGHGYYYVVRASTDCGTGSYGTSSAGVERQPTLACP